MRHSNTKMRVQIVLLFALAITSIGFSLYRRLAIPNDNNLSGDMPTYSNIPSPSTNEQVRAILVGILHQQIEYEDYFGNVPFKVYMVNNIDVWVYKYQQSVHTFTRLYEGEQWEVDLSKDVEGLLNLRLGSQEIVTCANFMGCSKRQVKGHNLEKRTWGSIDTYFQPALSWARTYYTYDKETTQLIYVNVNFYNITKDKADDVLNTFPDIELELQQLEYQALSI